MTKKGIVKVLAQNADLTQVEAKRVLQATFDTIIEVLAQERHIEIRNFGVFDVRTRAPRNARNPRTNEPVFVPEKTVVTFKPGRLMKERIS